MNRPPGLFAGSAHATLARTVEPNPEETIAFLSGIVYDHPGHTLTGAISFIARPDTQARAAYTQQVRRNPPFHPEYLVKAPPKDGSIIPQRVGDPIA